MSKIKVNKHVHINNSSIHDHWKEFVIYKMSSTLFIFSFQDSWEPWVKITVICVKNLKVLLDIVPNPVQVWSAKKVEIAQSWTWIWIKNPMPMFVQKIKCFPICWKNWNYPHQPIISTWTCPNWRIYIWWRHLNRKWRFSNLPEYSKKSSAGRYIYIWGRIPK